MVLKELLEENMSKWFIRQWSSLFAALATFATQPEAGLQFSPEYWDIISKTIKNQSPLPLIKETMHLLEKAHIYTKLDV